MIDLKNYDFYNFDLKDFENDGFIENDGIYGNSYFKKIDNDKIIVFYTNYDKNRILELFIFDKIKDIVGISSYNILLESVYNYIKHCFL